MIKISELEKEMEKMANASKEDLGKRTPGERNKYEESNLPLANGMLLHNDHSPTSAKADTSGSKRRINSNSIQAPIVLKYPRGG